MKITELMDQISEDTVELSQGPQLSSRRVKEAAMEKMRQQTGNKARRKLRRGMVVALAAVLALCLGGTAIAVANSAGVAELLGFSLFQRQLTRGEIETLDSVGTTEFDLSGSKNQSVETVSTGDGTSYERIVSNGVAVTPEAAIFDGHQLYLKLRIELPEEMAFEELGEDCYYHLIAEDFNEFPDYTGGWTGGTVDEATNGWILDPDNPGVAHVIWSANILDQNSPPTVFHFDSIQIQDADKDYTTVVEGSWDIPLPGMNPEQHIFVPAEGASIPINLPAEEDDGIPTTLERWPGGTVEVYFTGDIELTPLGVYYDECRCEPDMAPYGYGTPRPVIQVIGKDGSVMEPPYDLNMVDHLSVHDRLVLPVSP